MTPTPEQTAACAVYPSYAAILESITHTPDPAATLCVATWVLAEMADTFMLLAFCEACDDCDAADMRHPYAPGPGGSYDDGMAEAEEPDGLREECVRLAVELYAAILQAPGGYDPAPAIMRWCEDNEIGQRWKQPHPGRPYDARWNLYGAARCWGHYAVMEAVGHGVAWSDDNEPLNGGGYEARPVDPTVPTGGYWHVIDLSDGSVYDWTDEDDEPLTEDGARERAEHLNLPDVNALPAVGDLPGVSAEAPLWCDEWTERAFNARVERDRALAEQDEERAERAARNTQQED